MASPIGALRVELSANAAKFEKDMGKAQRSVRTSTRRMSKNIKGFDTSVGGLMGKLKSLKGLIVAGAAASFVVMAKRAARSAEEIKNVADKVGIGIEALQEWRFAAAQVGVQQNVLDLALQRFGRRVGEAKQGGGELKDTLIQYGIALTTSDGKTRKLEDTLLDYADAVKKADSSQEQLRISFKGFDSEGAALVNTLRKGKKGIKEIFEQARASGSVIEKGQILRGADISKQLTAVGAAIRSQLTQALLAAAPAILAGTEAMALLVRGISDYIDSSSRIPIRFKSVKRLEADLVDLGEQLKEAEAAQEKYNNRVRGLGPVLSSQRGLIASIKFEQGRYNEALAVSRARESKAKGNIPAAAAQTAAIRNLTNALLLQIEVAGKSVVQAELMAALKTVGIKQDTKEGRELARLISLKHGLIETQNALNIAQGFANQLGNEQLDILREAKDRADQQIVATRLAAEESNKWTRATNQAVEQIGTAFEDAIVNGESLRNVFQGLLKDIEKIILRIAVSEPLQKLLTTGVNLLVGAAGQASFEAAGAGQQGATFGFGPGTAEGGFITGPSLVGERGPELFVPETPGTILPNSALRTLQAGGREGATVIQELNINAGVPEAVRREFITLLPIIRAQAVEAVLAASDSGGVMARKMGRRGR